MRTYAIATVTLAAALTATACSSSKSNSTGGNSPSGAASSSSGASVSSGVTIAVKGGHLVGPDGKTLYYNTVDTASTISCTGSCASIWPPLLGTPKPGAGLNAGQFATTPRPGGGVQVTFNGHPLYEFSSDSGDTMMGSGLTDGGGKWVVAPKVPAAAGGAKSSSGSAPATSSSGGYGY